MTCQKGWPSGAEACFYVRALVDELDSGVIGERTVIRVVRRAVVAGTFRYGS